MTLQQEIRQAHPTSCTTPSSVSLRLWPRCWTGTPPRQRGSRSPGSQAAHLHCGHWHLLARRPGAEHWFRRLPARTSRCRDGNSFEFCSYPPPLRPEDAVIIISHRGTKTYSFLALELAKEKGAYTVAVTSTDPGPRLKVADVSLHTVQPERSAAFTISYTTALTVLAMLAVEMGAALGSDADVSNCETGCWTSPPP